MHVKDGGTIATPTPEQRELWRKALQPAWPKMVQDVGGDARRPSSSRWKPPTREPATKKQPKRCFASTRHRPSRAPAPPRGGAGAGGSGTGSSAGSPSSASPSSPSSWSLDVLGPRDPRAGARRRSASTSARPASSPRSGSRSIALVVGSFAGIGIATATGSHLVPRVGFGWVPQALGPGDGPPRRPDHRPASCWASPGSASSSSSRRYAVELRAPVLDWVGLAVPDSPSRSASCRRRCRYFVYAVWPALRPGLPEFQE